MSKKSILAAVAVLEDHRLDAHDGFGRGCSAGLRGLLESVECAGADIAVDDAESGQSRGDGQLPSFNLGQRSRLEASGHTASSR